MSRDLRFEAAKAALAGLMSASYAMRRGGEIFNENYAENPRLAAELAVAAADALLERLDETKGTLT